MKINLMKIKLGVKNITDYHAVSYITYLRYYKIKGRNIVWTV